jgi:hypothetical protein
MGTINELKIKHENKTLSDPAFSAVKRFRGGSERYDKL